MYEGTYKLERSPSGFSIGDTPLWRCTLTFDGLIIAVYAGAPRRAVHKANRAMNKAVSLRNVVKSVAGLCNNRPICQGPCCNEDLRDPNIQRTRDDGRQDDGYIDEHSKDYR